MKVVQRRHKASKLARKDFISNMPDNVVTNILNRLPLQYAVRTGILSRHWRFKWTMLSELVFDEEFYHYLIERRWDRNFERIITSLLLHFEGVISKFDIFLFDESYDIEQCILFLSKKGVKDLTVFKMNGEPLKLPTHIFSCLGLEHLKLQTCIFDPPASFHGFPNLLSLELCDLEFESGKFVQFFTKCPKLEILKMDSNTYDGQVKLGEIAKLINLKILTLFIFNLDHTEITSFSNIFELVGFFPKLQELELDFRCKSFTEDDARNRSSSTFPSLKTLKLSDINLDSDIVLSFAFEISRSSPNLKTLEITAGGDIEWPPVIFSPEKDYNAVELLQLRSVVFRGLEALEN